MFDNSLTISQIEAFDASYIEGMEGEHLTIKGHNVALVDLGGHFGYSALVTCEGRHIYHANDYELHHGSHTREWMRKWYVSTLNDLLFTEDEIVRECTYHELQLRERFLRDFYCARREYQSKWCCGEPEQWFKDERNTVVYSDVAFAFYHGYDSDFVRHMEELWDELHKINDPLRNYESAFDAFKRTMFDFEFAISWQGDWDVIRKFADVDGCDATDMLPKTGWNDEVIRAYYDAAQYVLDHTEY